MGLIIEVWCKDSQSLNWIKASLNRRRISPEHFDDNLESICEEVAKELRLSFEIQNKGKVLFKDRELQ